MKFFLVVCVAAFCHIDNALARLSVENQFRLNEVWRWHLEHQCPQVHAELGLRQFYNVGPSTTRQYDNVVLRLL